MRTLFHSLFDLHNEPNYIIESHSSQSNNRTHKHPAIMSPPSLWQHFRQIIGRALRETGQSIHRVALKAEAVAVTKHEYYDDPVLFEDHLSRHRKYFPLLTAGTPRIHANIGYIAPCATLVGSVTVGEGSSVWYGAVIRGDYGENVESFSSDTTNAPWELDKHRIRDRDDHHGGGVFIGNGTNVQDSCVITARKAHVKIGDGVTIGHLAQLHSCTVEDFCLIGMGSILNEGVTVEREALIGAGTVIAANTTIKSGELWVGNPGRRVRELTAKERERLHYQSSEYVQVARGQQGVMELGGNLDADGSSVYVVSAEETPKALPDGGPMKIEDGWSSKPKTIGIDNMPRRLQRDIKS